MEIVLNNIGYQDKLKNINYCFESGKITAIMGKSGSGKSLIGYVIMGLIQADKGYLTVDGIVNYDKIKFMKDVGYVFQNPREHFFCDTVYDEIAFGLKQFRFKLDKIDKQVNDALKMVGLDSNFASRKLNTLSSGEMARVAIASSLVLNPKVLILDEACVYLDNNGLKELVNLIKKMKTKYNKTIIVISNNADFIYSFCDNYILLDKGNLIISGRIDKKLMNDNIMYDYDIEVPLINKFVRIARNKKGILLEYTKNIDDLVMEVCKYEK